MNSLDRINKLSKIEFIEIFANIFEKSKWISEKLYDHRPFKNSTELSIKMLNIFENSGKENQLKYIIFIIQRLKKFQLIKKIFFQEEDY